MVINSTKFKEVEKKKSSKKGGENSREGLERYGQREIEAEDIEQWCKIMKVTFGWGKPHWGNSKKGV